MDLYHARQHLWGLARALYPNEEGKQKRVASLSIDGIHAFKEEELLAVIGSTPGQPYSDFGVTTDRDNILAMYFNEGFPDASFSATARCGRSTRSARRFIWAPTGC